MAGYESMPFDLDLDIDEVIEDLSQTTDPVIRLILDKYRVSQDGWLLFRSLHERSPDDNNLLGVAKLFRAKRDACADLLCEIYEQRREAGDG